MNRMQEVLDAIRKYKDQHDGNSPTFSDLMYMTDIKSKSTVSYYLDCLERCGAIRRAKRPAAWSIEVLMTSLPREWCPRILDRRKFNHGKTNKSKAMALEERIEQVVKAAQENGTAETPNVDMFYRGELTPVTHHATRIG